MYNVESLGIETTGQKLFAFINSRVTHHRSVYQDVELIPLEEFLARAGPEYQQNSDNPHQLMINRLKYELVIRAA